MAYDSVKLQNESPSSKNRYGKKEGPLEDKQFQGMLKNGADLTKNEPEIDPLEAEL